MKHKPRFLGLVDDARQRVTEVEIDEIRQRVERGDHPSVIVDVREESEWMAGRIPGALHLSKGVIERDIEGTLPDVNAQIVLYCAGGFRSVLAADNLRSMGYTNVVSMAGGMRGWRESGAPVEHDD